MQKICRRSRRSCKAVCKILCSKKNGVSVEILEIKQKVNRAEAEIGPVLESSTTCESGKNTICIQRKCAKHCDAAAFKKSLEGRAVVWYNREDKGEWTIWNWSKRKSAWKNCAP